MYKEIVTIATAFLICTFCFAWNAPMKFGKIDMKDLEMKVCDIDTSAEAVILCHYGYFDASSFTFRELIRIKILKKEGFRWADYVFYTSTKGDIKGITFNLENGEIVESKLTNESIFLDRTYEKYYNYRVTMPNVKVGSVIDIQCYYNGVPYWWNFQGQIPVKWSELVVEPHQFLGIKQNFFGFLQYHIQEDYRWVIKDAPAIHEEPFINSMNNYKQRIEMVFFSKIQGCSWNIENDYLLNECERFGDPIKINVFLQKYIKEIRDKSTTEADLIKNAFEFVRENVKWDENERLFTSSNSLQYMFNQGTGNAADINLLLYVVLKKLNLDVYPVILSTRENGVLLPFLPNLYKPNYVIVLLKSKEKDYLLDATEKYNSFDLLPERCLNGQGRIIDAVKSDWVPLETGKKDIYKATYTLELTENYMLKGTIFNIRKEYNALNYRKKYFSFNNQDEFLKEFIEERPGLDIIEYKVDNIDSVYKPVSDRYVVTISNFVTPIDSELYIWPLLYEALEKNPIIDDNRILPVDFSFPKELTVQVNIKIPDNYTIVSTPAPLNTKLSDNSLHCLYNISTTNNMITLTYKFELNKPIFLPNEHANLKGFYGLIVDKHKEPIILKIK